MEITRRDLQLVAEPRCEVSHKFGRKRDALFAPVPFAGARFVVPALGIHVGFAADRVSQRRDIEPVAKLLQDPLAFGPR